MQDAPPRTRAEDFETPKLRRCSFDLDTVSWAKAKKLGAGADGHVWRVNFGGDSTHYAIKVVSAFPSFMMKLEKPNLT